MVVAFILGAPLVVGLVVATIAVVEQTSLARP